jgi:hypothetical protein
MLEGVLVLVVDDEDGIALRNELGLSLISVSIESSLGI